MYVPLKKDFIILKKQIAGEEIISPEANSRVKFVDS
jgi:hypothetical protein